MNRTLAYILWILLLHIYTAVSAFQHPEGKFYKINGANLWTETIGKGDPLFLISGGPGGAHAGMHNFDPLSDSCTLVYVDYFGRGKSDTAKLPTEYSIERDISDLEALRIAMKYEKINILGHSYGSIVAQLYALRYPQNVKHLIIANGFFSGEMWQENDDNSNHEIRENYPEVWERLMQVRAEGAHSSHPLHQQIYGEVPYGFLYAYNPDKFRTSLDPKYPNKMNTKLYYQLVGDDGDFIIGGDIAKFDVRALLKNLKMPVLVSAGRYDRVSVPIFAVQYKKYCPQARFELFEYSGHNPQVEEPEKYFKIIREFLRK
ncbi:MAG TPA: alpha/beta fold hydrolase [Bacteroidia bacterium]|nr:alpha/beta fold hydrolase [Bacteroidia bacterium]HRH08525.1 alpha/beta fold hydrolase [Bacteroidia bacterium]